MLIRVSAARESPPTAAQEKRGRNRGKDAEGEEWENDGGRNGAGAMSRARGRACARECEGRNIGGECWLRRPVRSRRRGRRRGGIGREERGGGNWVARQAGRGLGRRERKERDVECPPDAEGHWRRHRRHRRPRRIAATAQKKKKKKKGKNSSKFEQTNQTRACVSSSLAASAMRALHFRPANNGTEPVDACVKERPSEQ